MKVYIGTDHAGFQLKEALIPFLTDLDHEVVDKGAFSFDGDDDYPDFIDPVAREVSDHHLHTRGIIIGGSGQGEAMVANRHDNVQAAVYYGGSEEIVRLAREHNDANVLALGSRFLTEEEAKRAVDIFLTTPFSGAERHERRIEKINE